MKILTTCGILFGKSPRMTDCMASILGNARFMMAKLPQPHAKTCSRRYAPKSKLSTTSHAAVPKTKTASRRSPSTRAVRRMHGTCTACGKSATCTASSRSKCPRIEAKRARVAWWRDVCWHVALIFMLNVCSKSEKFLHAQIIEIIIWFLFKFRNTMPKYGKANDSQQNYRRKLMISIPKHLNSMIWYCKNMKWVQIDIKLKSGIGIQ